ncbi:MAG: RRXRR domain-containing protein, partial [bacterium]
PAKARWLLNEGHAVVHKQYPFTIRLKRLVKEKMINGFKTGDIVKAVVPKGKKKGRHFARIAIRKTGYFKLNCTDGIRRDGVSSRYCKLIQPADGYRYFLKEVESKAC